MQAREFLRRVGSDEILIAGTRVPIELLIYAFRDGKTPEDMVRDHPSVSLSQAYGAIAHYLRHRDDMDAYVRRAERYRLHAHSQRVRRNSPPVVRRLLAQQAGHSVHSRGTR